MLAPNPQWTKLMEAAEALRRTKVVQCYHPSITRGCVLYGCALQAIGLGLFDNWIDWSKTADLIGLNDVQRSAVYRANDNLRWSFPKIAELLLYFAHQPSTLTRKDLQQLHIDHLNLGTLIPRT
jgi:hypothetical protein